MTPDQYIIGTLLGNAAFKRQYDYLVYIMKVIYICTVNCCNCSVCFEVWVYNYVQEMRHQQISPNEVIIRILEKAIGRVPQVGLF